MSSVFEFLKKELSNGKTTLSNAGLNRHLFDADLTTNNLETTFSREGLGSLRGIQAAAQGVYKGAVQPVANLAVRTALVGEADRKYKQKALDLIAKPGDIGADKLNETQQNIKKGFTIAGAVAPYGGVENLVTKGAERIAPKIIESPAAAFALRRAADVTSGQVLADPTGLTLKDRAKMAAGDAAFGGVMEGAGVVAKSLVNGVNTKLTKTEALNKLDQPVPTIRTQVTESGAKIQEPYKPRTIDVSNAQAKFFWENGRLPKEGEISPEFYNELGTTSLHFKEGATDLNPSNLISWSTDNPKFAQGITGEALQVGLSTRAAKPSEIPKQDLTVGQNVSPSDRKNVGKIVAVNKDGTYQVAFNGKEGTATKTFTKQELKPLISTKKGFTVQENIPEQTQKIIEKATGRKLNTGSKERGFVTSVKESDLADEVKDLTVGRYDTKKNTQLAKEAIQSIKRDGALASYNRLIELKPNEFNDQSIVEGFALARMLSKGDLSQKQVAADLLSHLAEVGTDAGRRTQAFALLSKMEPEGVLYIAQKQAKKAGKELTPDQIDQFTKAAEFISGMANGKEKNIATYQLAEELSKIIPTPVIDKVMTVWKAGLLTSLRTTGRNIVSTGLNFAFEKVKDVPASVLDMGISLRTGERTKVATTRGILSGATNEGFQKAKDIIRYGFDPSEALSRLDIKNVNFGEGRIANGFKYYTGAVFRALGAQDAIPYEAAFKSSLFDQASAAAINAGRRGDQGFILGLVKNPSEDMVLVALRDAEVATFKNSNSARRAITAAKKALEIDNNPYAKAAVDFVMPFTGVPTAVAGQMAQYMGGGLVTGGLKTAKVLWKGEAGNLQRQAVEELGRGIIGAGILAIGAELFRRGLMTGDYPTNQKEQQQWDLEGKKENSIKVGDTWYQVNSLGPQASVLLVGGKLAEKDKLDSDGNPVSKPVDTAFYGLKTISDASFLSGVQGVLDAVNDPSRGANKLLNSTIGSIPPNIVRDTAKNLDTDSEGRIIQRETNSPKDALFNSLPGLRDNQLPSRNVLGEVKTSGKKGWNFVDIFNTSTVKSDPIRDELSRLFKLEETATPGKINKQQTIGGSKVYFTPEELDQLEQSSGGAIKNSFGQIINDESYKNLEDSQKAKVLNSVVEDIRRTEAVKAAASSNKLTGEQAALALRSLTKDQRTLLTNPDTYQVDIPKTLTKKPISQEEATKALVALNSSNAQVNAQANTNFILGYNQNGKVGSTSVKGISISGTKLKSGGRGRKRGSLKIKSPRVKTTRQKSLKAPRVASGKVKKLTVKKYGKA